MASHDHWWRGFLYGDSLTQQSFSVGGWGALLADHFQRKVDVFNRGFSGYTSAYVSMIISRLLEKDQVALRNDVAFAVVFLGANDAVLPGRDHLGRYVTVDQYISNMRAISTALVNAGVAAERQIFIGPPPIAEGKWEEHCASRGRAMNLSNDHTQNYSRALAVLAEQLGVGEFIDLHSSMQQEENWPEMLSDGLHFSVSGNKFVFEKVVAAMERIKPNMVWAYPDCVDIDPENPVL